MLDKYYFDNGSKEKQMLSKILEHAKELEDFLDELQDTSKINQKDVSE